MQQQNKKEETESVGSIAKNPNPRANENIPEKKEEPGTQESNISEEVGSEITDGEAG